MLSYCPTRILHVFLAVIPAIWVAACNSAPRSVRYRFAIEVNDNGKVVVGSSVQEEVCEFNDGIFKGMGNGLNCGTRGEAVVVDLGSKGQLFVLLDGTDERRGSGFGIFLNGHMDLFSAIGLTATSFDRIVAQRDTVVSTGEAVPPLVRFSDPNVPSTVSAVDIHNLDKAFGSGVKFSRATVAITTDALTVNIEELLPWLKDYLRQNVTLDGQSATGGRPLTGRLAHLLYPGEFRWGFGNEH